VPESGKIGLASTNRGSKPTSYAKRSTTRCGIRQGMKSMKGESDCEVGEGWSADREGWPATDRPEGWHAGSSSFLSRGWLRRGGGLISENLRRWKEDYLPGICSARSPEGVRGADTVPSKNGRADEPKAGSVWIKRERDATRRAMGFEVQDENGSDWGGVDES